MVTGRPLLFRLFSSGFFHAFPSSAFDIKFVSIRQLFSTISSTLSRCAFNASPSVDPSNSRPVRPSFLTALPIICPSGRIWVPYTKVGPSVRASLHLSYFFELAFRFVHPSIGQSVRRIFSRFFRAFSHFFVFFAFFRDFFAIFSHSFMIPYTSQ